MLIKTHRRIKFPSIASQLTVLLVAFGLHTCVTSADPPLQAQSQHDQWSSFQNAGHPTVDENRLPTVWSPESNIAWTADIEGYGQSTPVAGHGQLVVTSTSGSNKDRYHLAAYAIESGEKRWQADFDNPSPFANTPMVSRAAPTSIVTESGFVAWFEGGLLMSVSPTGSVQWKHNFADVYGKIEARHGLAGSLEQDENHVFVWVERTGEPYLLAVEKRTGEIVWKVPGIGVTSWASPRLIDVGDSQHLVCSGSGKIVGYDPKSGARLWEFDKISNNSSCTPMPAGNSRFLVGASEGRGETDSGGAAESNGLIKILRNDDGTFTADFVWRAEKATCSFGSPIATADKALFVNRTGVLYQLDLETGRQISTTRLGSGSIWATPIVAGDYVYLFGTQGATSVLSLSTEKEIAVNRAWPTATEQPTTDGPSSSARVLYAATAVGKYLLLRSGDRLIAITATAK